MGSKPIIVVGAGIVGVSTALWLQRAGRDVILMDRDAPGSGASYGNSGLLAGWAVEPVNAPTLWKDAPKYLMSRDSPLFLKWAQLPWMLPWLARFMSHAVDHKTRRIVENMMPLLTDTVMQHRALVAGTPLEGWVRDSKCSFAYPTLKDFEKDQYSWNMKALAGLKPNILTGGEVQEEEPILGPAIACLAQLEGHGHITDPGRYVALLAQHFTQEGGQFVQAQVQDFTRSGDHVTQVETSEGAFECDQVVVTAGIWSKELMARLGLRIPLQAERGYHVIFENPSELPRNPLMITKGRFGVNPMDMGLRCAGVVELANHLTPASEAPVAFIRKQAAEVFPKLTYSGTQSWMGFRPTVPDCTPLIGQIGESGIYTGFGHQHVGLTSGPKTGRLLAQMITGSTPNMDMRPYAPERYAG